MNAILPSVRPGYAHALLTGTKTAEYDNGSLISLLARPYSCHSSTPDPAILRTVDPDRPF
jgi:hypothetical protein